MNEVYVGFGFVLLSWKNALLCLPQFPAIQFTFIGGLKQHLCSLDTNPGEDKLSLPEVSVSVVLGEQAAGKLVDYYCQLITLSLVPSSTITIHLL